MNLERALSFVFKDEKWITKCLLGIAIMIVPILNFAWIGYLIEIIQKPTTLPEWDALDKHWMRGLKYILATWIYAFPIFLILGLPAFLGLILIISSNIPEEAAVVLWVLAGLSFIFSLMLITLYGLLLSLVTPAILVTYARDERFSSLFAFNRYFSLIRGQFSNYLLIWVVTLAVGIVTSMAGSIVGVFLGWIPFLGGILSIAVSLFAGIYSQIVTYHLYGTLNE